MGVRVWSRFRRKKYSLRSDFEVFLKENFSCQVKQLTSRIDWVLDEILPGESVEPLKLHRAMRYSVLNGGKRIRPLLVYGTRLLFDEFTFDNQITLLDRAAAAVELIHAYSLIHDDLPSMDNDDLRRGRPTCHRAFDEATAILAGDALQALAFQVLTTHDITRVLLLATTIGSTGMAGGQVLDLSNDSSSLDQTALEQMYAMKTGALIEASVILGAMAATSMDEDLLKRLRDFARAIGVAFQIQDDILDLESSTKVLGKQQGSDLVQHKNTYPLIFGIPAAKTRVLELYQNALRALSPWGSKDSFLRGLARNMVLRDR